METCSCTHANPLLHVLCTASDHSRISSCTAGMTLAGLHCEERKLQWWFNTPVYITLEPNSYSRRLLNDQVPLLCTAALFARDGMPSNNVLINNPQASAQIFETTCYWERPFATNSYNIQHHVSVQALCQEGPCFIQHRSSCTCRLTWLSSRQTCMLCPCKRGRWHSCKWCRKLAHC